MLIEKYSFGMGDRFGKEGIAQLKAIQEINNLGLDFVPVWNKSYREHTIVKTTQKSVFKEALDATQICGWTGNYYVDADHISMSNVDQFVDFSNFFTIDVAHFIGQKVDENEKSAFIRNHSKYLGMLRVPGINCAFEITFLFLSNFADKYLKAINEVKKINDYIELKKGAGNYIPEVSMDECEIPQTPIELFFILAELKRIGVEVQTIAPKFSGLFAKGVDYIGNVEQFALEFEQDVAITQFAIEELQLPKNLKLSIHSGSDKFAIYPAMKKAITKFNAGIHIKTAGTTWLEEVIGLAQSEGEGLVMAKEIYAKSLERYDELTEPYATVLDINRHELPTALEVNSWKGKRFAETLIHNSNSSLYNKSFRQLVHVGYKIAAEMGEAYLNALDINRNNIEENVTYNLLERHLKLFI